MNNFNDQDTASQKLAENNEQQKLLQQKLNALVERANANLHCGADCMKQRTAKELEKNI